MAQSLDEFFSTRDWAKLGALWGGSITRDSADPKIVHLTLRARDGEQYRVRCICDGYPDAPPSVAFVNEAGLKDDATAWPRGTNELDQEVKPPPACFLCMPLTREGLAHHPNWRTEFPEQAWSPERHTLVDVFNRVHRLLNADYYSGRRG